MTNFTAQELADVQWAAARCRRLAKHAKPKGEHAERAERLEVLAAKIAAARARQGLSLPSIPAPPSFPMDTTPAGWTRLPLDSPAHPLHRG